jgi:chorismate lyase/3-hydroxybenzoate synthase
MTDPTGGKPRLELEAAPVREVELARDGRHALAVVAHAGAEFAGGDALVVRVPLEPLDAPVRAGGGATRGPLAEVWWTPERPVLGESRGLRTARTSELMFGAIELDGDDVEASARRGYRELIAHARDSGYPHLLRAWNVVPRIGDPAGAAEPGLDRYMLFCRARTGAFEEAYGPGFESRLCAGTAVGSDGGPLVVWFLAARSPGEHRENPRQVAAWRYPARYGPRPPAFARATLAPDELGTGLLLSGTASVRESESVHPGDTDAQLAETLRNIGALVGEDGPVRAAQVPYLRVYVKRRRDFDAVRRGLAGLERAGTRVAYLRADICRPELLLEIEGLAVPSGRAPLVPCVDVRGESA